MDLCSLVFTVAECGYQIETSEYLTVRQILTSEVDRQAVRVASKHKMFSQCCFHVGSASYMII